MSSYFQLKYSIRSGKGQWIMSYQMKVKNKPYNRKMIQGKRSITVRFIKDTYIKHKRQKGYAEKAFRIKTTKKKQKVLKSTKQQQQHNYRIWTMLIFISKWKKYSMCLIREDLLQKLFLFQIFFWSRHALFSCIYYSISSLHRNHINKRETEL